MGNMISICMGACLFRNDINTEHDIIENNNENNIKNKSEESKYYDYFDDIELNTPIRYYCHHKTKRFFTIEVPENAVDLFSRFDIDL